MTSEGRLQETPTFPRTYILLEVSFFRSRYVLPKLWKQEFS